MHFYLHFLFISFVLSAFLSVKAGMKGDPEPAVKVVLSDSTSAGAQESQKHVLGGSGTPSKISGDNQAEHTKTINHVSLPMNHDSKTRRDDIPPSWKSSSRDGSKTQKKYFDLNEGIEPESIYHENNLRRPFFIFKNWLKQLWLRLGDKFSSFILKKTFRRIYKTNSKKGIYDPVPFNRWDVLDAREMKKEAATLKEKLLEDFRSHPLFLDEREEMVTSPNLVKLLKWFEEFKEPKDWAKSDYNDLVTSLVAKVQTKEKLDSEDILTLQLIKYIGFFNREARDLFKAIVRGRNPSREEVPAPIVWKKLITADLLFQDYPRQTLYPHRYHGLIEQISMEWREEFGRRFIAGKLTCAAAKPPPGFGRKQERHLRKIFGKLKKIKFITRWPIHAEGRYDNPEGLVRRCVEFLADQVHLPPEVDVDSNRQHPIKLVYKILNHIYEHSQADFETQMMIEKLIKRNIYCQKTLYAHVILRQKFTPRDFASMTLLEDIGFFDLLTPEMKKQMRHLEEREVVLNISSDAFKNEKDMPHYEKDEWGLQPLVIPSSNSDPSSAPHLREELDKTIRRIDEINHDLQRLKQDDKSLERRQNLSQEKAQLLSWLIEIVLKGPRIWRSMREILIKQPELKMQIFSFLRKKVELIWEQHKVRGKHESAFVLPEFLYPMDKEIAEFKNRSALIVHLQGLVNDKFRRKLIDPEAAMDILDFLRRIENAWLEIKWSTLKWGAYNISPVELSRELLKLIREYGFGRLPADIHEVLVNLMAHLKYSDGTGYIKNLENLTFQDSVDYRVFAFTQRVIPEATNQLVDSLHKRLDGLSGKYN